MTLLRFMDGASGKNIGAFSWFATHGTSISRDNKLISRDNKGVAARLFEDIAFPENALLRRSTRTKMTNTRLRDFVQGKNFRRKYKFIENFYQNILSEIFHQKFLTDLFFPTLSIQIIKLGKLIILSVPRDFFTKFRTMVGRRLREALNETLISSSNGEFNNETHVVIVGLTNTYSQYITTFEEYVASTLYGPHTLSTYIQEFKKLARAMVEGINFPLKGPSPPDLSSIQISLLLGPFVDSPPESLKLVDIKEYIFFPKEGYFTKGDTPGATFWSANLRYDLLIEGTFVAVERLQGERWIVVYDDDDLSLFFKWKVDNSSYQGLTTIEWEIPNEAVSGVYKLKHFGETRIIILSPIS
uniref:Neutral ceramidase n=1 Tax=Cajanus cajan TaxID=3821 RepID=A0A151QWN0_CAJCA|nr:Neutral ceramidase [Cajanus cajan]